MVVDTSTQTLPDATRIISDAINFASRSTPEEADDGETNTYAPTAVSGATKRCVEEVVDAPQAPPLTADTAQDLEGDTIMDTCTERSDEGGLEADQSAPLPSECHQDLEERVARGKKDKTFALDPDALNVDQPESNIDEPSVGCRRGKRQKVPTKVLMGEYECNKTFLNRARKAVADAIYKGGNIDYAAKFAALLKKLKTPFSISTVSGDIESTELNEVVQISTHLSTKVVDVLMFHTSTLFRSKSAQEQQATTLFMDTQFVSHFTK